MKKSILLPIVAACAILCSCEKEMPEQNQESETTMISVAYPDTTEYVAITFACSGFSMDQRAMTRGELTADGKAMTDVWVLDYVGGTLQQQIHQTSTDTDFGTPTLNLSVGSHNLYFIASRGSSPTLNTDAHTLTFGKVLDTFYKSLALDVSATSSGNQTVTLERCVTKLQVTFNDAIPTGASSFNVTPSQWHYGIDYTTGEPTAATASQNIVVNIPSSYVGLTGQNLSIFCFSSDTEWTTDISVNCKASDNSILGQATITAAPLKRNRITSYSGPLFSAAGITTLALSSDWLTSYEATW